MRSFPAQAYGQRGALADLQAAAPMSAAGGGDLGASPPAPAPAGLSPEGILGPTQRPAEPVTAGLGEGPQVFPSDPDVLLRAIYQLYPHPDIGRFLKGG